MLPWSFMASHLGWSVDVSLGCHSVLQLNLKCPGAKVGIDVLVALPF